MKRIVSLSLVCLSLISLNSCFNDDIDDNCNETAFTINDYVYRAMNTVYLYRDEPALDNVFGPNSPANTDYNSYLSSFSQPEDLFESLIFDRQNVDKFSIITSDYVALQQFLDGVRASTGIEFDYYPVPGSATDYFAVIRLVINGSPAANQGLQRGQIVTRINGTTMNQNNINSLVRSETLTLEFATYDDNGTTQTSDDTITPNGLSDTVSRTVFTENPIHTSSIFTFSGKTVGYLMYNGFNSNFNSELNNVFGDFAANSVEEVVLDLRYNGGGSVNTASLLGSMVAGNQSRFGQVFSKLIYNSNLQANNQNFQFTNTIGGGTGLNSLGLDKVYVLTTNRSTASASELVINSLNSYIDVIHIGENTVGKTQASVTIYDSPNLGFENVNLCHTYAMLPLVANSVNVNDVAVPLNGLVPDISFNENPADYGTLGDVNEPLLARALQHISGLGRPSNSFDVSTNPLTNIEQYEQSMFLDTDDFLRNINN